MPFINNNQFARWFRNAAPYIKMHRDKTFVIGLPSNCLDDVNTSVIADDIQLLHQLGIKIIVVHGVPPLDNQEMTENGAATVTSKRQMTQCISQCALVSQNLMAQINAHTDPTNTMSVVSANYISACSYGIVDGIDYQHTGRVLKVNSKALQQQLNNDSIIVISPIGYGNQGDTYRLTFKDTLIAIAASINADKLILFVDTFPELQQSVSIYHPDELGKISPQLPEFDIAIDACDAKVARTHLLDMHTAGCLLQELFSSLGYGILVTSDKTHHIKKASADDANAIYDLIEPQIQQGALVDRKLIAISSQIDDYYLVIQDEIIVACGALFDIDSNCNEIASIATHDLHQGEGYASILVQHLESITRQQGKDTVIVLTTQAEQWFVRHHYQVIDIDALPEKRKARYCEYRASRVLEKRL